MAGKVAMRTFSGSKWQHSAGQRSLDQGTLSRENLPPMAYGSPDITSSGDVHKLLWRSKGPCPCRQAEWSLYLALRFSSYLL